MLFLGKYWVTLIVWALFPVLWISKVWAGPGSAWVVQSSGTKDLASHIQDDLGNGALNPSLLISALALDRLLQTNSAIVLVDVRPRQEFEKLRIPGSLNIAMFGLPTKSFLKSKRVILVHDGQDNLLLAKLCERLQRAGFNDVRVLSGGLNRWREIGGAIEGDPFALEKLNKLLPHTWEIGSRSGPWIVVEVSGSGQGLAPVDPALLVFSSSQEFGLASAIGGAAEAQDGREDIPVLITNEDGTGYAKFSIMATQARLKNVFYLEGGLMAYRKFLNQRQRVQGAGGNARPNRMMCPSCPL